MCKQNKAISSRTIKDVELYKAIQELRIRLVSFCEEDLGFYDEYDELLDSLHTQINGIDTDTETILAQSFLKDIEDMIESPESDHLSPEQFAALL